MNLQVQKTEQLITTVAPFILLSTNVSITVSNTLVDKTEHYLCSVLIWFAFYSVTYNVTSRC